MQREKERKPFSSEFVRYFQRLSPSDLRTRPYARSFYHDILIPKLKKGEPINAHTLKDLITCFQHDNKGAKFDLITLHGFAYIDYTSRRDSKHGRSPDMDPAGFVAAQQADRLIKELWQMEEGGKEK